MQFDRPDAVSAMNDAVAAVDEDGAAWEVVGDPMTPPVDELAAYEEKLRLRLNPSPADKRLEVGGLAWGRIDKDVARLRGLAAAIEDISATIKSGKERLARACTGEGFDDFRVAVEKIERTLDEFSSAVRAAASDLTAALDGIRTLYDTYRGQSLAWHLTFDGLSEPADWWRMWRNDADFLAENCSCAHDSGQTCGYVNGEQVEIINDQLVNRRLFDRLARWDCTGDAAVVTRQYRGTVDDARHERTLISGKVHNWYVATDQLKRNVDEMLAAGLENLRKIAESEVFAAITVPGGEELDASVDLADAEVARPPDPQLEVAPEPESALESAPVEPPVEAPPPAADSSTISGDGWSISVTSPDAAGYVEIRVGGGDGQARRYALDFEAASGLAPLGDEPGADSDVTPVPATTNGLCVIEDGPLTITAERPLFDPGTLKLVVDDGTGAPTTHSLDFAEMEQAIEPVAPAAPAEGAEEPADVEEPVDVAEPAEVDDDPAVAEVESADVVESADEPEHVTGSLYLDQPESLSGVLVPDQATGEAELISAASVDMWVGMGWSVHGDLFDNGDAVHSVHGVLVEYEPEGR